MDNVIINIDEAVDNVTISVSEAVDEVVVNVSDRIKASVEDIDTGIDDTRYVTSKGLFDSDYRRIHVGVEAPEDISMLWIKTTE